jgi:RsiW-degrading membrane proteinase PrsW (M82 family)
VPPLDPRAVLAGRPTARPSVGVVVTVAASSVCLAVALALMLHDGASGVATSVVLALAPLPLLLAGVLALDRLEPEPPDALVAAFAWGAGVSVLLALLVNTAGLELWTPLLGVEGGTYATVSLVAPVVEELVKGTVLVGLLWFRRHELNGPTDGIIYGSMVGLGFATVENISYYAFAAPGTLAWTFVVRGVVSPLLHPLCTSLVGVGVAAAALRPRGAGRARPVVAGFAGAIGLHALWNASTGFGLGGLLVAYVAGAAVLVVLGVVLHRDRLRIVGLVRTYLPPYEPTGVVTPADVRMLSTLRARRQARERVRARLGRGPARALADYQQAATELAMLHRRYDLGVVELPAFTARRDPLLLLMAHARAVFAR